MQRLSQLAGILFLAALPATAASEADPIPLGPLGGSGASIVVDPQDPDVILTIKYTLGLFRSIDGGLLFDAFGTGLPTGARGLTQDPRDEQTLFATDGGQVFRSTDFGANWSPLGFVTTETLKDIAIPTSGSTLLALDAFNVHRSVDDGATWSVAASTVPFGGTVFDRVEFAPSDPSVAYYASNQGVFRSNNNGASFFDPGPFSEWTQALTVSPTDPDIVFAGTPFDGLQRSIDGGLTFQVVGLDLSPTDNGEFFAWEPDGSRLWYTLLDGVVYSTDLGDTWIDSIAGLPQSLPIPLSMAFGSDGVRYLGAEGGGLGDSAGGGLYRMPAASSTWEHFAFLEGSVNDVMIAGPGGERVVGLGSGVWSGDPGETVTPTAWSADLGTDTRTLALDPTDSSRWVTGGLGAFGDNARVVVLTNNGQNFAPAYESFGAGNVTDIQFNPNNSGQVLGGIFPGGFGLSAIIRSTNGGDSWTPIGGTAGWATRAIAWDRLRPGRVLQLSDNNQWAGSNNGGQNWSGLQAAWPGTGPGMLLAYDPFQLGVLYRGETGTGLWRSDDDGASWSPLGVSLHAGSRIYLHQDLPGLLWVGDASGQLLVSTDYGASFSVVWTAPAGANVAAIDLDTSDGALLVGTVGATTWELPCGSPFVKLGDGTPGSGGLVPRHYPQGGLPQLGNTGFLLVGDEALGSSLAFLAIGFAPTSVPLFGGNLFVDSLITLTPASTSAGGAGEGAFVFPISIPTSPALAGATLASQYAVIDAGATDPSGFALSDGLLTTLLP